MSSISADYTLTFEEFAGAYRLQRRRRRFLSGPPERSRWYGCAWMAGLFVVLLIAAGVAMAVTGHQTIDASGRARTESDSPIFMFLVGLLPWPPLIGVLWLLLARSVFDRRTLSRMMVLFMVIGAGISAFGTFSERAAATGTRPAPSEASWLSLVPLLGTFVALCFFYFFILRRTVRVAWDGQPQLRRSIHFEADADRVIVQTPGDANRIRVGSGGVVQRERGPVPAVTVGADVPGGAEARAGRPADRGAAGTAPREIGGR